MYDAPTSHLEMFPDATFTTDDESVTVNALCELNYLHLHRPGANATKGEGAAFHARQLLVAADLGWAA